MIGLPLQGRVMESFLCRQPWFILLVQSDKKVAVVMPSKYGPWHLGVDDKQSIAYKNVRIYRPEKGEPLENTINNVADLIIR